MHLNQRRVVITGIGMITPLGLSAEETWQKMLKGESGIGPITQFDADKYGIPVKIAGEVQGFELTDFIPETQLPPLIERKGIDRCTQFALACTSMALADAHLDLSQENPERIGVWMGTGIGGEHTRFENQVRLLERGASRVSVWLITGTMSNEPPARTAERWGFTGHNPGAVAAACAASQFAIGEGVWVIKRDDADIMIVGGTESANSPLCIAGFAQMRALSRRNEEPQRASRPFDKDRDGFVMAEGCGIVILEELEHAQKRGAKIYGEVSGYGTTCDAHNITNPEPEGKEAARAMSLAIEKAGLTPSDVDYISAHGTATPIGDLAEARAIHRVFEDWPRFQRPRYPLISSTKSMVGHLLGAVGAVEFIVCLLAMRDNIVPPTINLDNPDPECTLGVLDFVPNQARHAIVNVALNNSFGFGGHNACLLVKKKRP